MSVSSETKSLVRLRAGNCCEYCGLHQDESPLVLLQVEHIIPKKHRGSDDESNLALACIDCNLHKGPNLTGIDPETTRITPLFHPRQQLWADHFVRDDGFVVGKTDIGRTTVIVLDMNSDEQLALRSC